MPDAHKTKEELVEELTAARGRIAALEAALAPNAPPRPECPATNETAQFYLTILNDAPALIWRAGRDAKCDWFNRTWLSFTGRGLEQELGDGWAEGVHRDDFDRCLQTYLKAFDARQFFQMEYRLRHHSGEFRWICDIGCPFTEPDGAFGGYIGYCFDVTQRRRDEEFRRDVERIIRHDVKAPLHALKALALALFDDVRDEELRPLVPRLHRGIASVVDLVDSTEKLMQIERGDYRPPDTRLELAAIVRNVFDTLAPQAEALGVALRLPEPAGPGAMGVFCRGEEVLIETMLTNLVKNALEASPPGAAVTVRLSRDEAGARVAIHNRGVIPEAIRDRFFEKYVTSGKPRGTGLGTYSAERIARAHGGLVGFATSEADGTTVTATLPASEAASG
ncbi:PAS domain-containing sensor histidine kinase [Solidesulfovibrio sp.]|uniref:PAS domain-containing sensor histidine kinase n=1 Tax=Solidesulfovibrio sp. TaxID=2910990 RepID=UPI002604F11D|nr:PAS domain-containing sensor histidine kinase [Solidesulfovibrio sp.]